MWRTHGPHGLAIATPEPATWPQLLLGLGGLAAAAARRSIDGAGGFVPARLAV
jgi:hypothetical protein